MRALVWSAAAVVVLGALAPAGAHAQRRPPARGRPRVEARRVAPRVYLGISLVGAEPQGEFGQRVDDAFGGQLDVTVPLALRGMLRLRGELGGLLYGHEHREMCFPAPIGCRIDLDLNTDNTIFFAGAGPELAWPGDLSPYVNGTFGVSYFSTFSSLGTNAESFARTEHFDDAVLAARAGAGLRVQLSHGRFPLFADLGARYHWNGVAEYLVEGGVVDEADGTLTLYPNETQANLVAFQAGVSVGLGRRSVEGGPAQSRRVRGRR
jgi:hypothetical protein